MVRENACYRFAPQPAEGGAVMVTQTGILKGLRVLVVDDYPEMVSLLGEILLEQGAFVVPVNNGAAAIRRVMLMKFDLVILDLRMPQPDGLKVIEFLGATRPGLLRRTLVLTGMRYDRGAIVLLERLHVPCLFKPFQVEEFVRAASRLSRPGPVTAA